MPAIIIKRKNILLNKSVEEVTSDSIVVVVKDDQVEVYTDQEAKDILSEE